MSHRSQGITQRSRWQIAFLGLVAAGLALLFALPGNAAASTVSCKGKTFASDPDTGPPIDNPLEYQFSCSEKVLAYSVISNRGVDYFDPEVEVFVGPPENGNVSSESFGCEGPIPGNGFGCKGSAQVPGADGPRFVSGALGLEEDPCGKHAKGAGFKAWVVVTTQQLDASSKTFLISSEPFRLYGPGCKTKPRKSRH